jgi:hypothetical protein
MHGAVIGAMPAARTPQRLRAYRGLKRNGRNKSGHFESAAVNLKATAAFP